jgi:hypothetical protein
MAASVTAALTASGESTSLNTSVPAAKASEPATSAGAGEARRATTAYTTQNATDELMPSTAAPADTRANSSPCSTA